MNLLLPATLALALGQVPPPQPPRGQNLPRAAVAAERQIAPSPSPGPGGRGPPPSCEDVRKKARFGIYFDKVDIEKLVQTVSDATCKTFILPENVRGKISIIGPDNGRMEVDSEQFYAAFLAALDSNNLAVTPSGRFLKILEKRAAKQSTIPTLLDPGESYTTNEQMVTKLFKIHYVEIEPLRGVLGQLTTPNGDTTPYPPDTIIINDVGSNMHRLERIIEQLDVRSSSDEIRVIQVKYASAQDVANTVQKIFEAKAKPGQRSTGFVTPPPNTPPGMPPAGQPSGQSSPEASGGPVTLTQMIPDERTNKLIVVASPAAFERIQILVNELDIPQSSGEGRINVYYLENANAEDMAATLQSLAQGTANRPHQPPGAPPPPPVPGAAHAVTAAELFSGEVKISADKATNSLVIVASQSDYRNLVKVIEKLDILRRQVFVEAVIMEVNLDRNASYGVDLHNGFTLKTDQGNLPVLVGTKYSTQGAPPSFDITSLAGFGGLLAGVQGPVLPELAKLGINIPSFGVVLHAMQQSSDVNVLSTPHLLTSDNEEAEITVGQNVPFQAGFSPASLGGLAGTSVGGVTPQLGLGLGGLGSFFAPIQRQNVDLKLTIKPQINESDFIRLVISEHTEEIASQDPVLGPTTSKRSAKTTVVARNQETVVIGGIMQDRVIESVSKVPILGDIPILGHLFREQTRRKVKTNLLLFLTPYIIKDQGDFRAIFERKMKERQEFVEQFYGQVPGYDAPVDFGRKVGPLGKISQALYREEAKLENGGPGLPGEKVIQPASSAPPPPPAPPSPPASPSPPSGP